MIGCPTCWAAAPRRAQSWGCPLADAYASLREGCEHVPPPKPVVVLWEVLREKGQRAELRAHMVECDAEPERLSEGVAFRCEHGRRWEYVWDLPAPCGCDARRQCNVA